MVQTQITERQQYWRDHVLAAASYEGSIVEYAAANNLTTKDLYPSSTERIAGGTDFRRYRGTVAIQFTAIRMSGCLKCAYVIPTFSLGIDIYTVQLLKAGKCRIVNTHVDNRSTKLQVLL